MPVISVRVEADDLAFLKERRMNVSEFVRGTMHTGIERLRFLEAQERLAKRRVPAREPLTDTIRSLRDADPLRD